MNLFIFCVLELLVHIDINNIRSNNETMKVTLLTDSRERSLFEYLDSYDFISKATLTTADYAFVTEDSVLEIFERKSLKDYADSFKDGRHDNKNKLLSMREKTGCNIYYVVEGIAPEDHAEKINGIPYSSIEASMFNMMSNCGIFVIRTESREDTARMFAAKHVALVNSIKNGKFELKYAVDPVPLLTEAPKITCDQIVRNMFTCIPGVSETTATGLAEHVKISDIILSKPIRNGLEGVKINGRKLSKTIVDKICTMMPGDISNMFVGIPGIKETTAIEDALVEASIQNIGDLCKKIEKSYGKKRTQKIKMILEHVYGSIL